MSLINTKSAPQAPVQTKHESSKYMLQYNAADILKQKTSYQVRTDAELTVYICTSKNIFNFRSGSSSNRVSLLFERTIEQTTGTMSLASKNNSNCYTRGPVAQASLQELQHYFYYNFYLADYNVQLTWCLGDFF